jgi:hypothetical protein
MCYGTSADNDRVIAIRADYFSMCQDVNALRQLHRQHSFAPWQMLGQRALQQFLQAALF